MRKKITAFITMLVIAFSLSPATFAEFESEDYDVEAMNILYTLGAFGETPEDEIDPESVITRGDFISIITNLLALEGTLGVQIFEDVGPDSPYFEATDSAYIYNFISGNGEGSFLPNESLSYNDAMTALVRLAGGERMAKIAGGYPLGYVSTARDLGITKGVTVSDMNELYMYEAAKLVLNAVTGNYYLFDLSENAIVQSDSTLLEDYRDIYEAEGTVTATPYSRLTMPEEAVKNALEINEIWYDNTNTDYENLLGYNIDYFYSDKNGDLELLYAAPSSKVNTIQINAEDILYYEDGRLNYLDANREKYIRLPSNLKVIYNQKADSGFLPEDLEIESGSMTFVANDGSNYDIVNITEYHAIVAGSIDLEEGIIGSKFEQGVSYNFDEEIVDRIEIENAAGEPLALTDLKEWDVLQIAASRDSKLAKIVVSNDVVETTIDAIVNEEDDLVVRSYMGNFKVSENQTVRDMLKIGIDCYLYLDTYERVIGVRIKGTTDGFAWLLKSYVDDIEEDTIYFKFLSSENKIETMPAKISKLRVNGEKVTLEGFPSSLLGEGFTEQLVNLTINSEDVITRITTADGSANQRNAVIKIMSGTSRKYRYFLEGMNFQGYLAATADTKVFVVPDETDNESDYMATDMSYFTNNTRYYIDAYNSDPDSVLPSVIVAHVENRELDVTGHSPSMLVTSVSTGVNDDDDEVRCFLTGYAGSAEVTIPEADNRAVLAADLKAGDVIKYALDLDGNIRSLVKVFDSQTHTVTPPAEYSEDDYGSVFHMSYGYVFSKDNNLLTLAASPSVNTTPGELTYLPRAEAAVYVVDSEKSTGKVQPSTFEAIRDYKVFGEGEYAFATLQYAVTQMIVVYK